eukprot:TRINITY_DN66630_c3_g1_i5.p1 TRINITY_DN66630_c3_g1~~TRINITY_DN66630_c3_g1_i5.p1  ORF type:complete len:535 (+),score=46.98 TRINITY_DN66630_c3_g1_i5:43-1647(+)
MLFKRPAAFAALSIFFTSYYCIATAGPLFEVSGGAELHSGYDFPSVIAMNLARQQAKILKTTTISLYGTTGLADLSNSTPLVSPGELSDTSSSADDTTNNISSSYDFVLTSDHAVTQYNNGSAASSSAFLPEVMATSTSPGLEFATKTSTRTTKMMRELLKLPSNNYNHKPPVTVARETATNRGSSQHQQTSIRQRTTVSLPSKMAKSTATTNFVTTTKQQMQTDVLPTTYLAFMTLVVVFGGVVMLRAAALVSNSSQQQQRPVTTKKNMNTINKEDKQQYPHNGIKVNISLVGSNPSNCGGGCGSPCSSSSLPSSCRSSSSNLSALPSCVDHVSPQKRTTPTRLTMTESEVKTKLQQPDTDNIIHTTKAKYKCISCLGSGSFGAVWLAEELQTRVRYAIKFTFEQGAKGLQQIAVEGFVQSSISTLLPSVTPKVIDSNLGFMVTECVSGHPLNEMIGEVSKELTKWWCYQILVAFRQLRQIGWLHGDVKQLNNVPTLTSGEFQLLQAKYGVLLALYAFCLTKLTSMRKISTSG